MEGRELRKWTLCSFSLHAVTRHLIPFTRLNLVSWVDGALSVLRLTPEKTSLKRGQRACSTPYVPEGVAPPQPALVGGSELLSLNPFLQIYNQNNQLRGCAQVHIFSKSLSGGELQVLRLLLTFWSILKFISFVARYFKILSTWFAYARSIPESEGTIQFMFFFLSG